MDDMYYFQLPDQQSELLQSLRNLYAEEKFFDVLLQVEGEFIKAHKIVLSSCSDYFRDILKECNTTDRPIITFADFQYDEMRTIVEFMYNGGLEATENQLIGFLKIAHLLKIKGIRDIIKNLEEAERRKATIPNEALEMEIGNPDQEIPLQSHQNSPDLHQGRSYPGVELTQLQPCWARLGSECGARTVAVVESSTKCMKHTSRVSPPNKAGEGIAVSNESSNEPELLMQPKKEPNEAVDSEDEVMILDDFPNQDPVAPRAGEKPQRPSGKRHFKCSKCGVAYLKKRFLREHIENSCRILHRYTCLHCEYSTNDKSNMVRHVKGLHTDQEVTFIDRGVGEKYRCSKCNKIYRSRAGLSQHLKYYCHKPPSFKCSQCSYLANMRSNLLLHIRRKHRQNSNSVDIGHGSPSHLEMSDKRRSNASHGDGQ